VVFAGDRGRAVARGRRSWRVGQECQRERALSGGCGGRRRRVGPRCQRRGGERAGGRGAGLARARGAGRAGLCARVSWARRFSGPAREKGNGPRGNERWAAGLGCWVGLGFWVFFPIPSSLLFLIQTKFEFKFKFEFKPHSIN